MLETLKSKIASRGEQPAICTEEEICSYAQLSRAVQRWGHELDGRRIDAGTVVGMRADYSIDAIALLIALFDRAAVVALVPPSAVDVERYIRDGHIQKLVTFAPKASTVWEEGVPREAHPLLERLRTDGHAGFIIYSSGSTGVPKAILHDLDRFLAKYETAAKQYRTLAFLLLDHIAGMDTMFYTLFSGGTLVLSQRRDPASICRVIEKHSVEVLPASPSFFKLLLVSKAYENFDLSSLKIITYGSEPMAEPTLAAINDLFPGVKIIQKYGTSEFGSPPTKSRSGRDLWIKLDSKHFEVKIIENILWVKATGAMLGYLNAEGANRDDGWICTGDEVRIEEGWIRILGRASDIINVGGEKVYPAEVEAVIEQMAEVAEVSVFGEAHPFLGQIVCAAVLPASDARDPKTLRQEVRRHCRQNLPSYKVPAKIIMKEHTFTTDRQKKIRRLASPTE